MKKNTPTNTMNSSGWVVRFWAADVLDLLPSQWPGRTGELPVPLI
jgi:hypothetical protein